MTGGGGWGAATVTASGAPTGAPGTAPCPPGPVLLVGNQGLLGLDSLAVLNEVCMKVVATSVVLLRVHHCCCCSVSIIHMKETTMDY